MGNDRAISLSTLIHLGLLFLLLAVSLEPVSARAETPAGVPISGPHNTRLSFDSTARVDDSTVATDVAAYLGKDVDRVDGSLLTRPLFQSPSFGPIAVFNNARTYHVSAATLSDTKFVVVHRDMGNRAYGTAIVGDVSGGAITYGAEYVFNAADTYRPSVAALSPTKLVMVYRDTGNSGYGKAIIGDVSGTTITYGPEYTFNAASTFCTSVAALSPTRFVVVYADYGNSEYGTAIVGDVDGASGRDITYGSEYVFNAAGTNLDANGVAALSDTKFVVAYQSGGGTAVVGEIGGASGRDITYGSKYIYNPAGTMFSSVTALSNARFVVAYRDNGNQGYGTAVVGDVGGAGGLDIAYGAEYVFNTYGTNFGTKGIAALSTTRFVLGYSNIRDDDCRVVVGEVTGNVIAYGSQTSVNPGSTSDREVAVTDLAGDFVVCWRDESDNDRGKSRVADVPNPTAVVLETFTVTSSSPALLSVLTVDGMWDLMIGAFFTLLSMLLAIWAAVDLVRTRHWQYAVPGSMYLLAGLSIGLDFLHVIQLDTMVCASNLVILLVGILLHRILQRADRRPAEIP